VCDEDTPLSAYEFKLLFIAYRAQVHLDRGRYINAMPPERGGDYWIDVRVRAAPDVPRPRAKASSFSFNGEGLLRRVIEQARRSS